MKLTPKQIIDNYKAQEREKLVKRMSAIAPKGGAATAKKGSAYYKRIAKVRWDKERAKDLSTA